MKAKENDLVKTYPGWFSHANKTQGETQLMFLKLCRDGRPAEVFLFFFSFYQFYDTAVLFQRAERVEVK